MRIDIYCNELNKTNPGIKALIKAVLPKGRLNVDLKKKLIVVQNFGKDDLDLILCLIFMHLDYIKLDLNPEKTFKIPNEDKILEQKKEQMIEKIKKRPETLTSKVKQFIMEEKVFTLADLKKKFSSNNEGSLRSCVNILKKEGVLHEIRAGKYCLL